MKVPGLAKNPIYWCVALVCLTISLVAFGPLAEAAEFGLVAEFSNVLVPTDNLNPGDVKASVMTLSLEDVDYYDISSLPAYMRSEIVSRDPGPGGGDLDEVLILTVRHVSGDIVFEGHVGEFHEDIYLGQVEKGEDMDLEFQIYLPGAETTNEYQGSGLRVKWIITAQYSDGGNDDSDNGGRKEDESEDKDESKDLPEKSEQGGESNDIPASRGQGTDREFNNQDGNLMEETIEIEESIPAGLPRTGMFPKHALFLIIAVMVMGIIAIIFKNTRTNM